MQGLAPWEIWISEAQERMVLAVPPAKLERLLQVCEDECCEVVLGTFSDDNRLVVKHHDAVHCDMDLKFLHDGLPPRAPEASYEAPQLDEPALPPEADHAQALRDVLDFGVAARSGSSASMTTRCRRPTLASRCAASPRTAQRTPPCWRPSSARRGGRSRTGKPALRQDRPGAMAEVRSMRRCATRSPAATPTTVVLDNHCWGNTRDPQCLGKLVRATEALCDLATHYRTPFVSGKDSLHNEFNTGERTIRIPGCILVTAMSVIDDVKKTMTSTSSAPAASWSWSASPRMS